MATDASTAPDAGGPIFIVGAPRSGTTLLQYMLRSHPNISLPTGESHFFVPLLRNAAQFGDLTQESAVEAVLRDMYRRSSNFLDTDLHGLRFDAHELALDLHRDGCRTMPEIISGLFTRNATAEGKRRWGDKTPYYVLHMPLLLKSFPGSQFIHLIRDGRDCALSLFRRKHDFGVYNAYYAAKYWRTYVDAGQHHGAQLGPTDYLEVRYEDLLSAPHDTAREICSFLGEPYDESVVEFKKSGEAGKTPLLQKPIQADNWGKWRTDLTSRQIRAFEGAAGDTLLRNRYDIATSARPHPLWTRALWRLHNNFVRKYLRPAPNQR